MSDIVNYAEKYSNEVDERFSIASVTEKAVNKNYEFNGVNTVYVYSVDTADVNDYVMTGSSRYGQPVELGNRVQKMTLTQDKSFTFTIDKRNNNDTMMTQHAGRCLQRQIDEVIVPMIDKFRLAKFAANAGIEFIWSPDSSNELEKSIYWNILRVSALMTNEKVPNKGRIIYMPPTTMLELKCDPKYTGVADAAHEIAAGNGAKTVDGMEIEVVPEDYLPEGTKYMIVHPCAMCSPVKLAEYNIHEDPPGISGWLVEGRTYYDAFILDNKKKAVALVSGNELSNTVNLHYGLHDLTQNNSMNDKQNEEQTNE